MYEQHEVFECPENEDTKLWRYMDFTKFISLIDSESLFFSRVDQLNDPFEGSWTSKNVEMRKAHFQNFPSESLQRHMDFMNKLSNLNQNWPRYTAVNCWHENEFESAAMWSLYLKSNEGIAIQTTISRLKKSIVDDHPIYIGRVKYIDYEMDYINPNNFLGAFTHKRKSFEHEKEVRALVFKPPTSELNLDFSQETISFGLPIKVDLKMLIEKIYIAPNAPTWIVELVKSILKRLGHKFEVNQSQLTKAPIF